ncbi:glycosyltransferase family 1 protein [Reyranella sp.]|uniref:glycosyltransferase family 4 protein n=1 Tax=Reyranella sp. TaxID=1929291 RepID=UPI00271F5336|nr:glycosyltransferase family 1 protein [Reyranella sp.]MDO8975586.1 glycosyltransferase family 1 protein [Reyranella sp.]
MSARLLYDLTGLIHWYAYFRHPGGVQRVIEKVASSDVVRQSSAVEFVVRILGSDRFYRIEPELIANLGSGRSSAISRLRRILAQGLRLATLPGMLSEGRHFHLPYLAAGLTRMEGLIEAWTEGAAGRSSPALDVVAPPGAQDTLFNPGDLWWQKKYVATVAGLKARTGVRIVQMIHDLYLIERPEWTPADSVRIFAEQLNGIAPSVDCWLTSSQFVKQQVQRYLADRSIPEKPIAVLPMGWDSFQRLRDAGHDRLSDRLVLGRHGLTDKPFMLSVGTIEPRKNVPALLDAADGLRARFGDAMPRLVIVGGYGWKAAEVRARLASGSRNGTLLWLENLSDGDLGVLYRNALFTVMPSHGEGWGLAVQESLALGVPCIASNAGATREAGLDLATYFDPSSSDGLTRAMVAWISDAEALAAARDRIERALATRTFPTWNDAGSVLLRSASP